MLKRVQNRLNKEVQDFNERQKKGEDGISVLLVDGNIAHWKGFINGPSDTPYANGYFQLDIVIHVEYPTYPPKMKFDTRIWHPQISFQTGEICLSILKEEWSPTLSIRTALLSIQALLCNPQPVVANQYKEQRELFNQTAKEWTQNYASKNKQEEKIQNLVNQGFDAVKVNEEQAANFLQGG